MTPGHTGQAAQPRDAAGSPLLPPGFVLEVDRGEEHAVPPWPGESALLGPVWSKTRYQSLLARDCARRAFTRLGHAPAGIARRPGGDPDWPVGLVGSMTHCEGYRAALVGRSSDARAAGIDAEPHRKLPAGVLGLISGPAEQEQLRRLNEQEPQICWDTLLFCVKEAVFKAWFPLTQIWLPMNRATVHLDRAGTFRVEIAAPPLPAAGTLPLQWSGRWGLDDGYVLAVTHRPLAG